MVLLDFWATWCPPCQRELPVLRKLEADYRAQGLVLVAASRDDPSDREEVVAGWVSKQGGEPLLVVFPSDQSARDWHALTLPTLYVLGRDGAIVAGHTGITSEGSLRQEIERALKAGQ